MAGMLKRHYKTRPDIIGSVLSERTIKESHIETVDCYGSYEEVLKLTLTGKIKKINQIPKEYQTNELILAIKLR